MRVNRGEIVLKCDFVAPDPARFEVFDTSAEHCRALHELLNGDRDFIFAAEIGYERRDEIAGPLCSECSLIKIIKSAETDAAGSACPRNQ